MSDTNCNKLVLVIDDDRDVRQAVLEALEMNAYEPVGARNGQEGLQQLRAGTTKPCLILLDVMMPVMDGLGFRALQTEDPELRSIPVVVLTAAASVEQVARQMDAAGFLRKPVRLDVLLDTVQRYC